MATLQIVPKPELSLYAVEQEIQALAECLETITPEQEPEFLLDLKNALEQAIEKRDRIGQFFAHLESQLALAQAEITRLQARKEWFERVLERMETYVVQIIESFGTDPKGKYRKLEGRTVTFSIRGVPPSVNILDETQVPLTYKKAVAKLPAEKWESLLDSLDVELRAEILEIAKVEYELSKTAVKQAFANKQEVPGADLKIGGHRLVRQ